MDTQNETTEETPDEKKQTLLGVLETLRVIVKRGEPAYVEMAANIQRREQEETDTLIREALDDGPYRTECIYCGSATCFGECGGTG